MTSFFGVALVLYMVVTMFSYFSDKRYYHKKGRRWVENGLTSMRNRYRDLAIEHQWYWEEGSNCAPNRYFWPDGSVKKNYSGNMLFPMGMYWRNSSGHYASKSMERRFQKEPGRMAPKG